MRWRGIGYSLLALGLVGGMPTVPRSSGTAPAEIAGVNVLEVDLHIHTFPADGTMSPIGIVLHAKRRGLDAIAITNHNSVLAAKIARAFSRTIGGPVVLVGQEITAPGWHLIGVGLDAFVDWRPPLREVVAAVHDQGGLAIAAHPTSKYRQAFDGPVLAELDGTEVLHGMVFKDSQDEQSSELVAFYERVKPHGVAAIGSTDHHFIDTLGSVRTYVFADDESEQGILGAIRAGRTVTVDPGGTAYGDQDLAAVLLPELRPEPVVRDVLRIVLGLIGWIGVVVLMLAGRGSSLDTARRPTATR